ncbi:MAG: hypothetical protein ABFD07_14120 [Methanobacterium sp.]
MTEAKRRYRFPKVYSDADFLKVLTDKPMKNSNIKLELIKIDPKYESISHEWVKQTMLKLVAERKAERVEIEGLKTYLWKKKEQGTENK